MFPASLAIPELNAFDDTAVTGKVDGAGAGARRDTVANDEFLVLAIAVVHDNALEENLAAAHAQLNGPEPAVMASDMNIVVIAAAIDVRVAQVVPAFSVLCVSRGAEHWRKRCEHKQCANRQNNVSLEHALLQSDSSGNKLADRKNSIGGAQCQQQARSRPCLMI